MALMFYGTRMDGNDVLINADAIIRVEPLSDGSRITFGFQVEGGRISMDVQEDLQTLNELIEEVETAKVRAHQDILNGSGAE